MLKKVAFALVAGSLVFAAQVASADDTQFWVGDRYQGVAALPFTTVEDLTGPEAPMAAPKAERVTPRQGDTQIAIVPAPYDMEGGYFN
jgi:hypothetical protein